MTIRVEKPGLLTTVQGSPRLGKRHLGVPASGPADPLSMALANRLVGNKAFAAALETTLTGIGLRFSNDAVIAITGANARCSLNGEALRQHTTVHVRCDDVLLIGSAEKGVRNYVAFAGGLEGDEVLGSVSTYLPGEFGGKAGRALVKGDELTCATPAEAIAVLRTPDEFQVPMLTSWSLRATKSFETANVDRPADLFETKLTVANRSDRMGTQLVGKRFTTQSGGQMPSAPVFPGVIQCTNHGSLFILGVDAGTTGGYPRVAKVTRADLHLLGQLRAGSQLTLIERDNEFAAHELKEKHSYWQRWLPEITDVI